MQVEGWFWCRSIAREGRKHDVHTVARLKKKHKLENLDYTDEIGLNRNLDPKPEIGYKSWTKYGVYSCPSLLFLRIENRAKTKRHVFCLRNWTLERKH